MELVLAEKLMYLPPLIVAALFALYRNNILCFWDCNPVGVAVKQVHGQVAVKISALLELARSTGIMLRNFPSAVARKISTSTDLVLHLLHRSALMILTSIQGILVTIKQSLSLIVYQMRNFFRHIFAVISNYTDYLRNTTVDFFRSVPKPSNHLYIAFLVIVTLACIGLILYGYRQAKSELPPEEPQHQPIVEQVEEKKPVRRRGKKTT